MNEASMEMLVVFKGFSTFFAAGAGVGAFAVVVDVDATGTEFVPDGAGVPVRLGWALTVKSLPWVLIIAAGNSANFSSSSAGSFPLAVWNSASTAGEDFVEHDQLYYITSVDRPRIHSRIHYSQRDVMWHRQCFHVRPQES